MRKYLLATIFSSCAFALASFQQLSAQTITSFSPTSGAVGTLVTINGANLSNPTAITIGGVNAIPISNTGTKLVAMVMPGSATGKVSVGTAIGASNFTVATQLPPNKRTGNPIVATSNGYPSGQGFAIALSADGKTAIMGANTDTFSVGGAYIFVKQGNGNWKQEGNKLVGSGSIGNAGQGLAVAINADGNTAVVGGANDSSGHGAAWVFIRKSDSTWVQQGYKITGTGAVGSAQQGYAVAISADGNTVVSGGIGDNNQLGAAWVFNRNNNVWQQQGNKLVGLNATAYYTQQGCSVAISADGSTIIVGGDGDNVYKGAVWVYTKPDGINWAQQGNKLTANITFFGYASAISADGNTAVIGSFAAGAGVFVRNNGNWTQQGNTLEGKNVINPPYSADEGSAVAISADGNTVISGGRGDNNSVGALWVFARDSNGNWSQWENKLSGSDSSGYSYLGASVTISADGGTAIAGGFDAAKAYTFVRPPAPVITSFTPTEGPVGSLLRISGSNLSFPTSLKIGGKDLLPISNNGSQLVAMVMPGTTTGAIAISTLGGTNAGGSKFDVIASKPPSKQQGTALVANKTDYKPYAGIGYSTALSADGNTAIAGWPWDSSGLGAAFIFARDKNDNWLQQGTKLVGTGAQDRPPYITGQGYGSIAISADGSTAIIGGEGDDNYSGAVWIFSKNSNGDWVQQGGKLADYGGIYNHYNYYEGLSVSISADGNTAVFGGYGVDNDNGAAWVCTRGADSTWAIQAKLSGSDATAKAMQGTTVAISADGNTVVVGGGGDSSGTGAIWVFVRNGNTWSQQGGKLVATGAIGASQGDRVAINADGTTILESASGDNHFVGAVWAFTRDNTGVWRQQGNKILAMDESNHGEFGDALDISADGNTTIIGGEYDGDNPYYPQGAVWIFTRDSAGVWSQHGKKFVGSGTNTNQGYAVAISADGNTAIEGGYIPGYNEGAAWIFTDSATAALPVTLTNFTAYPQGKGVQTAWSGYNEINMASYDIERSANGQQFNKIGNVTADDNNATENNYTWYDASPISGDNYYRIKAISKDGTVQYSRVAKVTIGTLSNIQVYPNPATNKTIQVQLNNVDAGTYAIAIYNEAGQKVYSGNYVHAGGYVTVPVAINGIAAGIYNVEVKGTNKSLATKVVMQ